MDSVKAKWTLLCDGGMGALPVGPDEEVGTVPNCLIIPMEGVTHLHNTLVQVKLMLAIPRRGEYVADKLIKRIDADLALLNPKDNEDG